MNTRGARLDMKELYGPGIGHALSEMNREENDSSVPPEPSSSDYFTLRLKRKRQSALLKDILREGGYGDLAKMVSVHKGE